MSSSLQEEVSVASSGNYWDIDGVRLWESTQPGLILYVPLQPSLATDQQQRYQLALTVERQWQEGTDQVTGATLSITTQLFGSQEFSAFEQQKQHWQQQLLSRGYGGEQNLTFAPLSLRQIQAQVLLDSQFGTVSLPRLDSQQAAPAGETSSFLLQLTAAGAHRWLEAMASRAEIPGTITFNYEYPQLLPPATAEVQVKGKGVFDYLASVLVRGDDGHYYGSQEQVEAAWQELIQRQLIAIELTQLLPPELNSLQGSLVQTFSDQARQHLFDLLFVLQGDPGTSHKLTWRSAEDVIDLHLVLSVTGGCTWLQGSMTGTLDQLCQGIDSSYVHSIYAEQSFPISITVQGDSLLRNVALSWSTDEGKLPEAIMFGSSGGQRDYTLTSRNPNQVTIRYQAKISFQPSQWSLVEINGAATVAEGGNRILLQPGNWIRHLQINFLLRQGNQIQPAADLSPGDYLVVNLSYSAPHLPQRIKAAARIAPTAPMQFTYLQDPQGRPGQLYFGAFGVLGGQIIRANDQPILTDEESVYILATAGSSNLQLVSRNSIVAENDSLLQRLLAGQMRLVIAQLP